MKPYIGLVHQDIGSAYGITFPDAPGCFAAADHLDQIFLMAEQALSLWQDGMMEEKRRLPPARELSELKADPAWADAFADAVLVIAVTARVTDLQHAA